MSISPAAEAEHTCLDASVVKISSYVSLDLAQPFGSVIHARFGPFFHEFIGGPLDYGRRVAEGLEITLDEEYSYQGGVLRLGSTILFDDITKLQTIRRFAVWEGQSFSFKTFLHGGSSKDLISVIDKFDISEGAAGIVLSPKPGAAAINRDGTNHLPELDQNVPGMGLLEIGYLSATRARMLPSWEGQRVRGGELFVEDKGTEEMTLLLVGDTSVTRLYPNHWEANEQEILDKFSEVVVGWQPNS